ncbi:tudor domain-containing protein 7 isoform X3 [Ascaphus truei]|uniref:tudor domain-containing protein 7 isoform X3 n=1 Tax=Ascaphus truei TaxID=8439 RepID=UPI003F592751
MPAAETKMLESEKDLVAKMLRAVLQSNKSGVPLSRLQGEFKSLTGEWIPFKEMGFSTLDTYLKTIPAVVKAEVNRVGKPKATLRKPDFASQQERIVRRPVPLNARGRGNFWLGHVSPVYGGGVLGEMPVQRHPPILNRPERRPTLPPRFQKEVPPHPFQSPRMDSNANATNTGKTTILGGFSSNLSEIQSNLRELLGKHSSGIWMSKLPQFYKETFKQDLSAEVLRHVGNWTHLCTAQKLMTGGHTEVVLYPTSKKQQTIVKSTPQRSNDQVKSTLPPVQSKATSSPKQTTSLVTDAELKQNILDILAQNSSGLWSNALPKVFEDTFKKKFPAEVLLNLDSLSDICTVECVSEKPYKAILYTKSTTSKDPNHNLSVINQKPKREHNKEPPPLTELLEELDIDMTPPPLVIPSKMSPSVLIVELNNTNEVVIRYVGRDYSAAQECMEDEMKEYYSKNKTSAPLSSLRLGQLVAANAEDDTWLRAQVSSIEEDKIKICYVDYGFFEVVDRAKVRKLDKPFYSLPFQATKCRLAGLEVFCEDNVLVKAVESKACGKILSLEILENSENPLVVLYDTSGDDDININATCLRELHDKSLSLQLKVNSSYSNVIVTNVCSDGTLFCQVPSKGLAKLCETLQRIETYFNVKEMTSEFCISLPFCGKICLFHFKGKWARVEITSVHSSRALDIQFLDTGTIASVKVSELKEIPSSFLRDIITIPPQGLKCCLADLPLNIGMWTPDAVLWLRNTVLNCSDCSIKVVKMDESKGMVYVYLFTPKNFPDPDHSINRQITNEDLWKHQKDVFLSINPGRASGAMSKGDATAHKAGLTHMGPLKEQTNVIKKPILEHSSVLSGIDLPPPLPLPKPGEHMDIFVSVACHPGHFVLQPWKELHNLEVIMEEMLLYYSTTEEKPVSVEKNKLYAAKIYNKWYRVLLTGILTNGLVSMYELDYGTHELVNCRKVQPLIDKFRKLPFQAVTGQLAGVKCEQWSEEASIVFRNHVEKKPLVALIQAVYESNNPWDRKVVAYIVDTSLPDTDLWVHDLMSEYLIELSKA